MTSSTPRIKKWPAALIAATCAVGLALGTGTTAFGSTTPKTAKSAASAKTASPNTVSSSYVVLTNVGSGKNLDIDGPSTSDGAVLHIWHSYSGATSQQWVLKPYQTVNGHVAYQLVDNFSGECADVNGPSTSDGAQLHQWHCGSVPQPASQAWFLDPVAYNGGNVFQIRNAYSSRCMDVTDSNYNDGTVLQQYGCSKGANQQWRASGTGLGAPAGYTLGNPAGSHVVEEPFTAAHKYVDWNLCGPGSTTAALQWWDRPVFSSGTSTVAMPDGGTQTMDGNYGQIYLSYLAFQVRPPGWPSPGELSGSGTSWGTATQDVADTLNWEASNRDSSTWSTMFYGVDTHPVTKNGSTVDDSKLHNEIASDIGGIFHKPAVVAVYDGDLTDDWPSTSHTAHLITVIGYDASHYTFLETCGNAGCQTTGGSTGQGFGVHTIDRAQLAKAVLDDGSIGALVW